MDRRTPGCDSSSGVVHNGNLSKRITIVVKTVTTIGIRIESRTRSYVAHRESCKTFRPLVVATKPREWTVPGW